MPAEGLSSPSLSPISLNQAVEMVLVMEECGSIQYLGEIDRPVHLSNINYFYS